MAGGFEELSDLEWRLFEDIFTPGAVEARPGDAPCAVSADSEHVAVYLDYGLPLV